MMHQRFNYFEFVRAVEKVCLNHPFVSNFYTQRYKLNTTEDIDYPAIVMTTNEVVVGESITQVNFNLMYVDRLTETRDNTLALYSVGIDVVSEILNALRNKLNMDSMTELKFNLFYEQFADKVAGVFTPVSIDMPSNIGRCDWIPVDNCEECRYE